MQKPFSIKEGRSWRRALDNHDVGHAFPVPSRLWPQGVNLATLLATSSHIFCLSSSVSSAISSTFCLYLSLSPPLLFSTLVLECRSFQLDFLPFSFASILAPTSKLFSFAFPSHSPQCRRELRVHGRHRSSDYLHTCRDLCGATHVRLGAFGAFGAPPRPPRSEAPGTGCSRRWCKGSRPTWNGCAMALNPL